MAELKRMGLGDVEHYPCIDEADKKKNRVDDDDKIRMGQTTESITEPSKALALTAGETSSNICALPSSSCTVPPKTLAIAPSTFLPLPNITTASTTLMSTNVGIKGEKFIMVYEPEAASIYARLLPVDKLVGENGDVILKAFDPGRKFIVVDAGGTVLFM
ncbi:Hypothetical predicted protein [Mytilus galloprovincialis]|uniref:Uncharacterized protein n=1 Tax=Mytilus galloprovincialis TaxID=29158 RepID=A0A8B6EZQ5_MYTGA|nr:Hypothetical predicted protein [Mytilus galloprovincialis]